MAGKNSGKPWVLLLLMLCGIVIGSFIGQLTQGISWLEWLDFGMNFGIGMDGGNGVLVLNLGAIVFSFGLTIKISICSILGVVIAFLVYRKL